MRRFLRISKLASRALALSALSAAFFGVLWACGSSGLDETATNRDQDAGMTRKDGAPVELEDTGTATDSGAPPPPSCGKYCDLVMSSCTGDNVQYASNDECLAFCAHLPQTGDGEPKQAPSLSCRQYWADSPAHTNPAAYCLAAGPFGGNVCGDRCKAFCDVLLSACSPDGGTPIYGSASECATACASFSYRDAGIDGGGEGPQGPASGDTLNCRLFALRAATKNPEKCALLHPDGGACKD